MAGPFFHVGAVATCPHGGQVTTITTNSRVLASGLLVALATDQFVVAGCPNLPQPCVQVQWTVPAARSRVNGQPPITALSVGLCIAANGAPSGPAVVASTQVRAVAS